VTDPHGLVVDPDRVERPGTGATPDADPRRTLRAWGAGAVLAWGVLIATTHVWGERLIAELGREALRLSAPPIVGWEDPAIGWPALLAVGAAAGTLAVIRHFPTLRWHRLVMVAGLLTVVWSVSLAVARSPVDGADPSRLTFEGLTRPLVLAGDEYLLDVPLVGDDPLGFIEGFTTNIDDHVTHVRSHPPFFLLLLSWLPQLWGRSRCRFWGLTWGFGRGGVVGACI
jgi:hypothetical protein